MVPLGIRTPPPPPQGWWAATDGSGEGLAGWGTVVFKYPLVSEAPDYVLHGPVVVGRWDPLWVGAQDATNNTAELSALAELFLWLLSEAPDGGSVLVHIRFDSFYAANIAQGIWDPKANEVLSARVRALALLVEERRTLSWEHVYGHTGAHDNELADRAAAAGSAGEISRHSHRWARPPENGPLAPPVAPAQANPRASRGVKRKPAARSPRPPPVKRRPAGPEVPPAAAPPPAPGTPPHIAGLMQDMADRGMIPRTTPAQRRRYKRTAGTTYGVPKHLSVAFDWGYIHPDLPPPADYVWRCRAGVYSLAPRGG